MGKRNRFRDHADPVVQEWGRTYPKFPGVAECARLIRAGKARGSMAEIIVHELAENAAECLPEMIATFRDDPDATVRLYVMMALDIARPPAAVGFLADVLREGDPRFTPYAKWALQGINTRESRRALWDATHP
ncbi:MAG TPA: hypothetical protein VFV87_21865 [Pirellulaceae bacterium]|nr:hypothetical protein [Pirellulaceae bacterium]